MYKFTALPISFSNLPSFAFAIISLCSSNILIKRVSFLVVFKEIIFSALVSVLQSYKNKITKIYTQYVYLFKAV